MYEALVARVRYHIQKANFMGLKDAESTLLLNEAADAIEELDTLLDGVAADNDALCETIERLKPRWISTAERLPEDRHDVLVYAGVLFPYITVGYYDGLWKFSYNDEEIAGGADYWMLLPKTPKEET